MLFLSSFRKVEGFNQTSRKRGSYENSRGSARNADVPKGIVVCVTPI